MARVSFSLDSEMADIIPGGPRSSMGNTVDEGSMVDEETPAAPSKINKRTPSRASMTESEAAWDIHVSSDEGDPTAKIYSSSTLAKIFTLKLEPLRRTRATAS